MKCFFSQWSAVLQWSALDDCPRIRLLDLRVGLNRSWFRHGVALAVTLLALVGLLQSSSQPKGAVPGRFLKNDAESSGFPILPVPGSSAALSWSLLAKEFWFWYIPHVKRSSSAAAIDIHPYAGTMFVRGSRSGACCIATACASLFQIARGDVLAYGGCCVHVVKVDSPIWVSASAHMTSTQSLSPKPSSAPALVNTSEESWCGGMVRVNLKCIEAGMACHARHSILWLEKPPNSSSTDAPYHLATIDRGHATAGGQNRHGDFDPLSPAPVVIVTLWCIQCLGPWERDLYTPRCWGLKVLQ